MATAVHFCALVLGLEVVGLTSAGAANVIASCCGIAVSFLGNRWYVFNMRDDALAKQAARFVTTRPSAGLAVRGEVKRGPIHAAPKAPVHGGGEAPAPGSEFFTLYGLIALAHGIVLWVWADVASLDYRRGFVVATLRQVVCSYIGNQRLVFR